VKPLYMTSFPYLWYPRLWSWFDMNSTVWP
jgi:hypothetical protein